MSEYVDDLAYLLALAREYGMRAPDKVLADSAYVGLSWGDVVLSRSHGETYYVVSTNDGHTEHTAALHAVLRVKGMLS